MKQLTVFILVYSALASSALGQAISEDTYCIKLKSISKEKYFVCSNLDSVPVKFRPLYENGLKEMGQLLSRFNEQPLINSNKEIFRAITFGPFNDPKGVEVMTIEKKDKDVELTFKMVGKLKDSTIFVYRKVFPPDLWDRFIALTDTYFLTHPSFKNFPMPVHDGYTTVYEGHLSNRYHFLERHVIHLKDPELMAIHKFLYSAMGGFFDPNCKKDTREN